MGALKDEWNFIEDEMLRTNIASELQKIHFDVLLVNEYNVYYSPEAMTLNARDHRSCERRGGRAGGRREDDRDRAQRARDH